MLFDRYIDRHVTRLKPAKLRRTGLEHADKQGHACSSSSLEIVGLNLASRTNRDDLSALVQEGRVGKQLCPAPSSLPLTFPA